MDPLLDSLPDDPAMLKAMIIVQRAEADRMAASVRAYEAREIDQLQLARSSPSSLRTSAS